ncbi:5-hydroxytryptamine receptor 1A [Condylostylus longicornis]|uniref:5-hydroxytryptamine receptor 1A n=1 Tax=Condylostylus longicornis TaxID=2530218 RepID=UPI00244E412B|nr:5-hydroxytryptamine receptor 1A [Condylostylus longicornis]
MFYKCLIKNRELGYERIFISNISWKQGYPDYKLQTLTEHTRHIFIGFASAFLIISVVANIATIIVNTRRKMRMFFRIMLYSLAASDLITTIFSTTGYISQLSTKYIQIWHLGDIMCACIPFMSTAAILINSMTLVGIAFDRYMAVVKVVSGVNWEPGILCCFAFVILVWGTAAGLASPMLMSYYTGTILLIITNPNDPNQCVEAKSVEMCASDKALNSYYFIIIFSVVFVPTVLTFIWLNSVVAIEIWNRHKFNNSENTVENSSETSSSTKNLASPSTLKTTLENSTSNIADINDIQNKLDDTNVIVSVNISNIQSTSKQHQAIESEIISTTVGVKMQYTSSQQQQQHQYKFHKQPLPSRVNHENMKHLQNYPTHKRRKTRQLRLFIVIILLITIFLICRLPTWIFLLMRVYGVYNRSIHWIMHYSFGILSLFNCVLNPFCYTFMAETTRFICATAKIFKNFIKCFGDIIFRPFVCIWYLLNPKLNPKNHSNYQISVM